MKVHLRRVSVSGGCETTQCENSNKPQRPTNTRGNLERVSIETMERHLNAAGGHPESGANSYPTLMTVSSPHQGKARKPCKVPFTLPTNPFRIEGQEGKALILQISQPHCMASGRSPPPSSGLRPKNRNPVFQSKGQVSKGERPRLRGPGQTMERVGGTCNFITMENTQ